MNDSFPPDYPRIFSVLSEMYRTPPTLEGFASWRSALDGENVAPLAPLKDELGALDVATSAVVDDIQTEFARLLVGPSSPPSPPWESVYTSPGRLMMQEAYDSIMALYGRAGFGVTDRTLLEDHLSMELLFLALLLERVATADGEKREAALAMTDLLLDDHLNKWIVPFTQDMERAARVPLYKALARVTRDMVSLIQADGSDGAAEG